MKTKILGALAAMSALLGSQQSHALSLEVAPLALTVKAEVLGVQAGVNGQNAIIFAGETARKLAQGAGIAFNASTQMIVATGKEVNDLVVYTAKTAGTIGRQGFIMTKDFAFDAINLAQNGLKNGVKIVVGAGRLVLKSTSYALQTMVNLSQKSVILVLDTGVKVLQTGGMIINGSIDFLKGLIGWILPF